MTCRWLVGAALALAFTNAPAQASDIDGSAGERGFKFLQVNSDARSAALADAGVATASGPTAALSNPAGLADVTGPSAAIGHAEWLASIRDEYLGFAQPAWGGGIGIALRMQSSGDIPLRSIDDGNGLTGVPTTDPLGTYGVYDAALSVAYARRRDDFRWGVAVTGIHEKIYRDEVTAYGFDAGVLWERGPWQAGAAVRNAGFSGNLRSEDVPLPWDTRVGGAYTREFGTYSLTGLLDLRYAPDWYETAHAGIETRISDMLALRLGYRAGLNGSTDTDGLTAGTGLRIGAVGVDYAYIPTDTGLGSKHLFTLSYCH